MWAVRIPNRMRSYLPAVGGVFAGLVLITLFAVFDDGGNQPPATAAADKNVTRLNPADAAAARRAPGIRIERRDFAAPRGPFKLPTPTAPKEEARPDPPDAPDAPDAEQPVAPALPAWRRFAVPASGVGDRPMIAVIIDDMGVDLPGSAQAIALPGPLTLSFLPYASELTRQLDAARRAGHELMLHVSMAPVSSRTDTGPNVLAADLGARELIRRLDWALGRFSGYVGVNNHMGSGFTTDVDAMALVLGELRRRGLLFVDSRTTTRSVAPQTAQILDLPFAERDVFIDDEAAPDVVAAQLLKTERIARRDGTAIAIGHPRQITLAALRRWLPSLAGRGFALAPVSAVVARRRGGAQPAQAARQ